MDTNNQSPSPPQPQPQPISPNKKLRSQDPDIIVVVGNDQDNNKQEFKCYSFILCYASDYFDTMLSHSLLEKQTSKIELPDKDPEEWKEFYKFMDPSSYYYKYNNYNNRRRRKRNSKNEKHVEEEEEEGDDDNDVVCVNKENARMLTPWFREYQMNDLCLECDEIMSTKSYISTIINIDPPPPPPYKNNNVSTSTTTTTSTTTSSSSSSSDDTYIIIDTTKYWKSINDKRKINIVHNLLDFITFCDQYTLPKSLSTSLSILGIFMTIGIDILYENYDIFQKVLQLYISYNMNVNNNERDDSLGQSLSRCKDTVQFYNDVVNYIMCDSRTSSNNTTNNDSIDHDHDEQMKKIDWDNPYLKPMLTSKLEILRTKRQMEDLRYKLSQTRKRLVLEKDMLQNIKIDMKALPEMFWLRYGHKYDIDGLESKLQSMIDEMIEEY